jgi:hypothetical protein
MMAEALGWLGRMITVLQLGHFQQGAYATLHERVSHFRAFSRWSLLPSGDMPIESPARSHSIAGKTSAAPRWALDSKIAGGFNADPDNE